MRFRSLPAMALALLPLSAAAVPVTYEFSGMAGGYSGAPPEWAGEGFPNVEYTGRFTLETDAAAEYWYPNFSTYYGAVSGVQVDIGPGGSLARYVQGDWLMNPDSPLSSSVATLLDDFPSGWEEEGPPYDQAIVAATLAPQQGDSPFIKRSFSFSAFAMNADMFGSMPTLDQFPVYPSLPDHFWEFSISRTVFDDAGNWMSSSSFSGSITSMRRVSAEVPEPATWELLMIGLAGLLVARRTRFVRASAD